MTNPEGVEEFPLPDNLPVPTSTQAATLHLGGHPLPPLIELPSTSGGYVDLFLLSLARPVLLFIYPRTASPGEQVADSWNAIPGARGCTPHLCSVRDHVASLHAKEPNLAIFGLSSQPTDVQSEAVQRLHLPFPLLSDAEFRLQKALDLPTLTWQGSTYFARTTLLLREGQVTQYQHPVFPPTQAAREALKMLDAGKTEPSAAAADATATDAPEKMSSDQAYAVEERVEKLLESIQRIEDDRVRPVTLSSLSSSSQMPVPRDLTGSIRSFKGLERLTTATGGATDWRNSLVAVDTETGEVVGMLAQNVTLSQQRPRPTVSYNAASPISDEDDEIPTPPATGQPTSIKAAHSTYFDKPNEKAQQITLAAAAHTYHDPDVRPASREGSVLGEDTFAPPPVPDKPSFLRPNDRVSVRASVRSSTASVPFHTANEAMDETSAEELSEADAGGFSDGEAVDGLVRTRANHVEVHRPDLLRDGEANEDEDEGTNSDASGSTIGGPAVQLWRKARGGKEGEARRKAKKAARAAIAEQERSQRLAAVAQRRTAPNQTSDASVRTSRAETAREGDVESAGEETETEAAEAEEFQSPSADTVNAARAHRIQRDRLGTSIVRSIEDRVWHSALESGCLPIDAPYTHLAAMAAFGGPRRKEHNPEDISDAITDGEESGVEMAAKGERPRKKKAKVGTGNVPTAAMQGNSVLIEFLAGSRIAASVIHDAASTLFGHVDATTTTTTTASNAFTPTDLDVIPQTGVLRYIPVLPSHLLWFFGLDHGAKEESRSRDVKVKSAASVALKQTALPASYVEQFSQMNVSTIGNDLVRLTTSAPTYLYGVASRGASVAWGSLASWSVGAGGWIGTSVQQYVKGERQGDDEDGGYDDLLNASQPGDEDADEFEWITSGYRADSVGKTPRPVYRRKRPVPSLYGGFQVRQRQDDRDDERSTTAPLSFDDASTIKFASNRISIVHFDHEGIGRHAVVGIAGAQI